jgi:hypothetical protein
MVNECVVLLLPGIAVYLSVPEIISEVDFVTHNDRVIIRMTIRAVDLQLNMSYVRLCIFCIPEECP